MSFTLRDLADALDRVALAMDAESVVVRAGARDELRQAAERKRLAIDAADTIMGQAESLSRAAWPADRARLAQTVRRMQAAARRNAAVLQGALEGTRRLFACLGEAAQQASSTGTYGPDGARRRTVEAVGTIHRSV